MREILKRCPKDGTRVVKAGRMITRKGIIQRWRCRYGHNINYGYIKRFEG